jgi:hypothetical protein
MQAIRRGRGGVWSPWHQFVAWKRRLSTLEVGLERNGSSSQANTRGTFARQWAAKKTNQNLLEVHDRFLDVSRLYWYAHRTNS